MSTLDLPRLVFSGDFQADVSTVNNDVRHYDRASFEDRFQQPQTGPSLGGWWNPSGSGAFRLIDCTVRGVTYRDGTAQTPGSADQATAGLRITGAATRVSGKLVDLDPQWQLASELWGLGVRLADADDKTLLSGLFEPTSFRDIIFGQQRSPSAVYTSRLVELEHVPAGRSLLVDQLLDAAEDGTLAIRLTTFGYVTNSRDPRFTLGRVVGVIGPGRSGQPRRFVLGRRFAPADGNATPEGVNFFDAVLDPPARRLSVDLGNALPLSGSSGAIADVGPLMVAVLRTPDSPDGTPGVREGETVPAADLLTVGSIEYRTPQWLVSTAGVVDLALDDAGVALAADHPLALVAPDGDNARMVIRETFGGLLARCDQVVVRVDTRSEETVRVPVRLYAARWGTPLPQVRISTQLQPPISGLGGGNPDDPDPPTATIPDINTPPEAVAVPSGTTTGGDGSAEVVLEVRDPGNPRGYLDGQIYLVSYGLDGPAGTQQHQFDLIIVHARDAFTAPAHPTWVDDIQPIFSQYGNVYPIMSRRMVDLADYDAVHENAAILELAFSRDIADPNHMPVSRDLSADKQSMILAWLRERDGSGARRLRHGPRKPSTSPSPVPALHAPEAAARSAEEAEEPRSDELRGKTLAIRQALDGLGRVSTAREE
ncbi:MAG: hypothetical protein ACRDRV_05345 [Pseudonocardiaceae bacterium]